MLKLYYGLLEDERRVVNPDPYFNGMFDMHKIDTDFGRRVVKECSGVAKVHNYVTLELSNGEFISPEKLSSGAKNVLLMKEFPDIICDVLWCGENCEPFISEIAEERDLTVYTTRPFHPDLNYLFKDGIYFINSGNIVRNNLEYIRECIKYKL